MVKRMVNTVYSIGYSGFSIHDFLSALKEHDIALVVDVRSSPFSNRFSDYNKDALENTLKASGIHYRNYAAEFGARQEDRRFYGQDGYLDFEVFSRSDPFLRGVGKLCESMRRDYTFALMCAEKRPMDCHRAILVSRAFFERGYKVIHLLPNGRTMTQEDLNDQLIELYFPNRDQMTLFGDTQDRESLLKAAYRKRNAEIGYRLGDFE